MIDIKLIRQNPDFVKEALRKRRENPTIIDEILKIDEEWRTAITKTNELRSRRNEISKNVARLKKEGKNAEAEALIEEGKRLGEETKGLQDNKIVGQDEERKRMANSEWHALTT